MTVPAGATEFAYLVHLPPWMETGRTCRVCVMGLATIKDKDGSAHEVSFSSTNQNEQLVAVVEPGKLDIETERTSLTAVAGQAITLPVRISRGKSLQGEAKVELVTPAHIRGLAAESVRIAADRNEGTLTIRCGSDLQGPFNMPMIVRATLMDNGRPVVAEAKVEISPEK
jgi:hypothetical protein